MADGHVVSRLLVYILLAAFLLPSGAQQHPDYMVNTHKVGQRCIPPQRVKHAVLKWSKHGSTTIFLPDKKHVAGVDIVLLCGDIHPQPGPRIISRRTDKVSASQGNKSSTFQAFSRHVHGTRNDHYPEILWLVYIRLVEACEKELPCLKCKISKSNVNKTHTEVNNKPLLFCYYLLLLFVYL